MAELGIYCPTLGRPGHLAKLAASVAAATRSDYRLLFIVEPHDQASVDAAAATGAAVLVTEAETYSNAIQAAYEHDDSQVFLLANDDFEFTDGWDTAALAHMTNGISVVGVNDGSPSCSFTTINLVRRSYIDTDSGVIDMPGRVLYPYRHNYVDTELAQTAKHRGVFAEAPDSLIRHIHPDWGLAEVDATYRKTRSEFERDAKTFGDRQHLWA